MTLIMMFQEETIFDFVRTFFQYKMNPFIRGILVLITNYLIKKHAKTVGKTTKQ